MVSGPEDGNHATLIYGYSDTYYLCRNAWGTPFADKGSFRIAKDAVDFSFLIV